MAIKRGQARLWLARLLVAAATAVAAVAVFRASHPPTRGVPAPVQTDAAREIHRLLDDAAAAPRPRYTLVYFGDSFALSENLFTQVEATPIQLRRQLGTTMRSLGAGEPPDLRLVPITWSGLSTWSLYYLADSIVDLKPEFVVVECNLFNFSSFWAKRDRRILASLLPLARLPEALNLPLGDTGLTLDTWIFGRLALRLGAMPVWSVVQHAQVRLSDEYRTLGDELQRFVGATHLEFRKAVSMFRLADTRLPDRDRSTRAYSRMLLGRSLDGLEGDDPALRMLAASLERLKAAGIPVLLFIPPYNLDHLKELGLLADSRLDQTIERVRETAERSGARFHDSHKLLGDQYFRDAMDHLHEQGNIDGHRLLAIDLARAMSDDWLKILEAHR